MGYQTTTTSGRQLNGFPAFAYQNMPNLRPALDPQDAAASVAPGPAKPAFPQKKRAGAAMVRPDSLGNSGGILSRPKGTAITGDPLG